MNDIQAWRKYQRKRLIAARESITAEVHQQWSQEISKFLKDGFPKLQEMAIGIYWPFRGEYDPRSVGQYFQHLGATLALPEIIGENAPLCFREWQSGAAMQAGAYGIPIPVKTKTTRVDAIIIPMVGFDQYGFRLGYGKGYFDRTLATYQPQPLVIGIAFEIQRLETVLPQPHDIAMQYIVTEAGIFQPQDKKLMSQLVSDHARK